MSNCRVSSFQLTRSARLVLAHRALRYASYRDSILAVVEQQGLRVPGLRPREVANGLAVAYLRKRITPDDKKAFLVALSHLSIEC